MVTALDFRAYGNQTYTCSWEIQSLFWNISFDISQFPMQNITSNYLTYECIVYSRTKNILHDRNFDSNSIEIQKSVSVSWIHLRFSPSECRKYRLRITFSVTQLRSCAKNKHRTIFGMYTHNLIFRKGVFRVVIRIVLTDWKLEELFYIIFTSHRNILKESPTAKFILFSFANIYNSKLKFTISWVLTWKRLINCSSTSVKSVIDIIKWGLLFSL